MDWMSGLILGPCASTTLRTRWRHRFGHSAHLARVAGPVPASQEVEGQGLASTRPRVLWSCKTKNKKESQSLFLIS
eukprot:COSAG01_NODE_26069_length_724_cov_1.390400_1_plen_75_part_01